MTAFDHFMLWLLPKLQFLALCIAVVVVSSDARAVDLCDQFRPTVTREAQAVYGLGAPVPMFVAQLRQESSCRAGITAWDNGRGLAQFMDGTADQVARLFPELGAPAPYSPTWAIRAQVRYGGWLFDRVKGADSCNRWAAALKSYNAGLGFVQHAQRISAQPGVWFGVTEDINAGQRGDNFAASRLYPRLVLFKHQPLYATWGPTLCLENQ